MNKVHNPNWALLVISAALLIAPCQRIVAQSGGIHLNLKTAAGATELPVGQWGCYSTRHAGPCYLANRKVSPLFSFPIVVGQQRDELLSIGSKTPPGKPRLRPERVTLLRRSAGLSPAAVAGDAGGPAPVARIVDADSDGYVTAASIEFTKASVTQDIATRRDTNGAPSPAPG